MNALVYGRSKKAPSGAQKPSTALKKLCPALQAGDAWMLRCEADLARQKAHELDAWGWITESGLEKAIPGRHPSQAMLPLD